MQTKNLNVQKSNQKIRKKFTYKLINKIKKLNKI
jgi:hypothetical protein